MKSFDVTSILAPVDLSGHDLPALRHARLMAERFGAKLTALYADPVVYPADYAAAAQGFFIEPRETDRSALLAEIEAHVRPILAGRQFEILVAIGHPVAAILGVAADRHPDLMVMGSHGRSGWHRAILGSVSDGVVRGSRCPVLVVTTLQGEIPTNPPAVTRIVCPVNFTDTARNAAAVASRMALAFHAELHLVHVVEPEAVTAEGGDEARVKEWAGVLAQPRVSYREVVARGGAAERVLDCVDDARADLLVVGAQHKRFHDTTVVGSTTEQVVRLAPCPVLVVPREAHVRQVEEESREPELAGAR